MATGEDQMQGLSASIKCERKSKDDVVDWKCIIDETVIYMSYRSVFDHPIYPLHLHLIECLALQVVRRCTIDQGANEVALSVVSGVHFKASQGLSSIWAGPACSDMSGGGRHMCGCTVEEGPVPTTEHTVKKARND
ncbi:hypothetical protein IGI04_029363 [Brassica rapa subsp. trilocularis]|uniref:Uncharacterized protein n=1 Tax=Brassica rapa subsp. trilocularis TaxID=1813537 RepID=A0ABQ7LNL4_BRACM|nr:hypothetical protein IGI04_029363 [Brassica rapa subsp. trilocularis]